MKLKICMLLQFPHYGGDMRIKPQIGICSYLTNFGHQVTWVIWSYERHQAEPFFFNDVLVYITPWRQYSTDSFIFILASIPNRIMDTVRRMRCILAIFKKDKYNLILVRNSIFDGLLAIYIKRRYKITLVFELSSPLEQEWESFKIEQ